MCGADSGWMRLSALRLPRFVGRQRDSPGALAKLGCVRIARTILFFLARSAFAARRMMTQAPRFTDTVTPACTSSDHHPEVRAQRASKDAAEAPGPSPSRLADFVGERLRMTGESQDDGRKSVFGADRV